MRSKVTKREQILIINTSVHRVLSMSISAQFLQSGDFSLHKLEHNNMQQKTLEIEKKNQLVHIKWIIYFCVFFTEANISSRHPYML